MLLSKYQGRIQIYVSLQAFGEQILTPFSSGAIGGGNQGAMFGLGNRVSTAIRARNPARNYIVGIAGSVRAPEFGTVTDYALNGARIPYVFTIRLPAGGASGFEPPTTAISGIGSETFYGLLEFGLYLAGQ